MLSRKNPQQVKVTYNSEVIPTASVLEANTLVLEIIGLTKDDIYSNFILSRSKYRSFLSSSDKDKKSLINRFSNGILVDQSIEAVQADMVPLTEQALKLDREIAYAQGQLSTIDSQIDKVSGNLRETKANIEATLADIDRKIAGKRGEIREQKEKQRQLNADYKTVMEILRKAEEMDTEVYYDLNGCTAYLRSIWDDSLFGEFPDCTGKITQLNEDMERIKDELHDRKTAYDDFRKLVDESADRLEAADSDLSQFIRDTAEEKVALKRQQDALKEKLAALATSLNDCYARRQRGVTYIQSLKNMLAGTIECPECHHKWITSSNTPIEKLEKNLSLADRCLGSIDNRIRKDNRSSEDIRAKALELREKSEEIDKRCDDKQSARDFVRRKHQELERQAFDMDRELSRLRTRLEKAENDIDMMQQEVYSTVLSRIRSKLQDLIIRTKGTVENIKVLEGSIASLEVSKVNVSAEDPDRFLEGLKESRKGVEVSLGTNQAERRKVQDKLDRLAVQESRFNEFKTYLANSKIEAISSMTNGFLESIGSDIRISFSGVTTLRSGKVRDKISITLLRDGVDCGSYGKFSQGERSRCELATILALQKLINTNCEGDGGLDLLVIDEVMDGTDETGLSHIFETLNSLHVTSLVISHGAIQENYQPRLVVNKQNGVSFI